MPADLSKPSKSGRGLQVVRYSAGATPGDAAVYLPDTLGELPLFYTGADVAFIGGSPVAAGGHNVLEAVGTGRICGLIHRFRGGRSILTGRRFPR